MPDTPTTPAARESRAADWLPEEWTDWRAASDAGEPDQLHFAQVCRGEHAFWAPNPDGHTCPPVLCGSTADYVWLTSSRQVFDEYAAAAAVVLGPDVELVCTSCAEWVHA